MAGADCSDMALPTDVMISEIATCQALEKAACGTSNRDQES